MKIAVATDDYLNVTGHVGRCLGFLIYNVENGKIISEEIRENNFTNHGRGASHEHGHEHNHEHGKSGHAKLAEGINDCSHLICHGAGWRLAKDLKAENIELVLTRETNAKSSAKKLENGELIIDQTLTCHSH